MFGRRAGFSEPPLERRLRGAVAPTLAEPQGGPPALAGKSAPPAAAPELLYEQVRTDEFYEIKRQIFAALIEIIDVSQLTKMEPQRARDEIRDVINEIVSAKKVAMPALERKELLEDICNDVLGYGPLQPLLARDDIADIMVNGCKGIFIEVDG